MTITVKLFATLRRERFEEAPVDLPEGAAVSSVAAHLHLPEEEVAIVFVNGRHAEPDTVLHAGDTVSIFPPIGGG
jgi:molybdopterin converting factor small subunit